MNLDAEPYASPGTKMLPAREQGDSPPSMTSQSTINRAGAGVRFAAVLVGFILYLANFIANPAAAQSIEPALRIVEQAVTQKKIPGASVLVMQHGRLITAKSFGLCDVDASRPFQQDTICWIASLTKPITATAAMVLVEQDKLNLDDPIEKYLPEFKGLKTEDGQPGRVTVRQLMCHASGIAASVPLRPSFFFTQSWYRQSLAEVVSAIAKRPLQFAPGRESRYSNAAPYVLGRIIELQSGQSFGEFVRQHVLGKLGMDDTGFSVPRGKVDRVAVVYRREKESAVVYCRYDKNWDVRMCMPDGGLFSTPADIARFANAFLKDGVGILSAESVQTMLSEQSEGYGLGWILDRKDQFSHWGSSGTLVWADRRTGIVGVVFAQIQDIPLLTGIHAQFRDAVTKIFAEE